VPHPRTHCPRAQHPIRAPTLHEPAALHALVVQERHGDGRIQDVFNLRTGGMGHLLRMAGNKEATGLKVAAMRTKSDRILIAVLILAGLILSVPLAYTLLF
jgi:hypothetical protein